MPPIVHVLTYCSHPTSAYGSLMVFDSIRTGFPTAKIEVFDNGSCDEVLPEIRSACEKIGAEFWVMKNRHYSDHLRFILLEREHPEGVSLILSDPDVVYWESMEHLNFAPSLMAGRLMPVQKNSGFQTMARFHPSLLFIPDVHKLRRAVEKIKSCSFAWDAIGPRTSWIDGEPYFWDTLADLFNSLKTECRAFNEEELDLYDHLFFGTHLPMLDVFDTQATRDMCIESHRLAATGNIAALRGIWRKQQEFFETPQGGEVAVPTLDPVRSGVMKTLNLMAGWKGEEYSKSQLWSSALRTMKSIRPET